MEPDGNGCGCIVVAALLLLFISFGPCQQMHDEERKREKARQEASLKSEWVVLGEGYHDRTEYVSNDHQITIIYFSDGRTLPLNGIHKMDHPKGSKIRVSQWKFGTGTPLEKMEDKYKIESLEAEAK